MSLHPQPAYVVPDQTAHVARAIFPKDNPVMRLFDDLHLVVADHDFADLFPTGGQPAEAPVRLALATTLLQFFEGLTDRQAADAVHTRIDWKYVLCLELTDVGFDHTVLSEFRTRLLAHGAEGRLFDAILELARGRGLLNAGGRQRSDSTHVLGAMRAMTRLEVVTEALRHALNVLATTAPDWLRAHTTPAWVDRYGLPTSEFRFPKREAGRRAWATQAGVDGLALLAVAREVPHRARCGTSPPWRSCTRFGCRTSSWSTGPTASASAGGRTTRRHRPAATSARHTTPRRGTPRRVRPCGAVTRSTAQRRVTTRRRT